MRGWGGGGWGLFAHESLESQCSRDKNTSPQNSCFAIRKVRNVTFEEARIRILLMCQPQEQTAE